MIKAVWFDIGGTVHTQKATPENDKMFAQKIFHFLITHGVKTTETPMELLQHINSGAKAYKAFSEQELIELPGDDIWRNFMLRDFEIPIENLKGLGEELSYLFDRWHKVIVRREGLEETLCQLKEAGYRLGVISNIMSRTFVPRILEEHGVREYFEHLLLSSDFGIRKPRREMFDEAGKRMGLDASELAYVGDTISRDVRGVRNAGWQMMIQIDNPAVYHKDEKYRGLGYEADYHIKSLREIVLILKGFPAGLKERGSCS